jgi:hypothetical protein
MGTYEYFSVFLFDAQLARIVFELQKFSILQLLKLVLIQVEFHTLFEAPEVDEKKSFSTSKNNDE